MLKIGKKAEKTKYSGIEYLSREKKIGKYAIYNGIEYELTSEKSIYYLCTTDEKETDDTFEKFYSAYLKKIDLSELGDIYKYNPYALYKGEKFYILGKFNSGYDVCCTREQAEKYGFRLVNKGEYRGWFPASEVDVIEEKQEVIYYPD